MGRSVRQSAIKLWGVKIDFIYSLFPQFFWEDARILDVGAGTGEKGLINFISRGVKSSNCFAIDAVNRMALLELAGCNCVIMNLQKEKISDRIGGSFDVIICSHFLEHVTQRCEDSLLEQFSKIGSNVVICYPTRPMMKKGKKKKPFGHQRTPDGERIVENLSLYFDQVTAEEINYQIFIVARGNKSECKN